MIFLLCINGIFLNSCQDEFEDNKVEKQVTLQENYKIEDGIVKIESKQILKSILDTYQESTENQNAFNDEIRFLENQGFKPLTPIFDDGDTEKIEQFLIQKKKNKEKRASEYGITEDEEVEFDIDDDLIQDPSLAAILNENREIIVGDSLYKYTEHGLYFCLENDKQKLYNYLKNLNTTEKLSTIRTGKSKNNSKLIESGISLFIPEPLDQGIKFKDDLVFPTPNIPIPDLFPTPRLIKADLPVARIDKDGFFEKIFGETEVDTENYGDGRRIKVKFWNQNYFIFSSLGCSARFQKRVKFLGVSGWQKSYATQIELGVNDISYDYNFNSPVYNEAKYNFENFFIEVNGVKYSGSGRQILEFPAGATNFPFSDTYWVPITVHIRNLKLFELNHANYKDYNKAVDFAVKQAFRAIVSLRPDLKVTSEKIQKDEVPYQVIAANPDLNKVRISTQGKRWTNNNDNAITHYFDFNFLLSYNSKIEYDKAEDYLKGLQGSKKYDAIRADIYGAALHNNVWKGRRLILGN